MNPDSYDFLGINKSVTVPWNASADKPIDSERVGWGWIVSPISSASAPISIAKHPSEIMSPAFTPTIPIPKICLV